MPSHTCQFFFRNRRNKKTRRRNRKFVVSSTSRLEVKHNSHRSSRPSSLMGPHQKSRAYVCDKFNKNSKTKTSNVYIRDRDITIISHTCQHPCPPISPNKHVNTCIMIDWNTDFPNLPPPEGGNHVLRFSEQDFGKAFRVADASDHQSIAVYGRLGRNDGTPRNFLFYKVSPSRGRKGLNKLWPRVRQTIPLAMRRKPNVARGKTAGGTSSRYICFGYRKDPLSKEVSKYSFKSSLGDDVEQTDQNIECLFSELTLGFEKLANGILKFLPETLILDEIKERIRLPSLGHGGRYTQLSVGLDYWSQVHIDDDYFYCTLSCLSRDESEHDNVLYYFVFPEYKIAVPLKSGDVIVFNPRVLHCCTNPSLPGASIFSSYVSAKTVNTQFALQSS